MPIPISGCIFSGIPRQRVFSLVVRVLFEGGSSTKQCRLFQGHISRALPEFLSSSDTGLHLMMDILVTDLSYQLLERVLLILHRPDDQYFPFYGHIGGCVRFDICLLC